MSKSGFRKRCRRDRRARPSLSFAGLMPGSASVKKPAQPTEVVNKAIISRTGLVFISFSPSNFA
jgi:hypothetical protein